MKLNSGRWAHAASGWKKSLSNEHNVGIATEMQAGLGPQPSASLGVTFAGLVGRTSGCLSV